MSVKDIEAAVENLSEDDLAAFRTWFAEFDAVVWDRQIEEDVASGKLDGLVSEALEDLRQGRCTDR